MYNEYNQYNKRSFGQNQQDPLSPYSGGSPPTALSDVPNIVTMYDELNPNMQNLVLLRLLKRCPVSTLQFVSSLILPVLKYDIITLLPVELTYKILNYLDIEDLYHCMMVCHAWKKIIDSPGAELAIWKQKLIEKQWYDEEKIKAILTEYKQRKLKAKAKKASDYLMNAMCASNSNSSYYTTTSASSSSTSYTYNNNNNNNNKSNNNDNNSSNNNTSMNNYNTFDNNQYNNSCLSSSSNINNNSVNNSSTYKNCPKNFYKRIYRRNHLLNHNWKHGRCRQISFSGHEQNVVTCLQFDSERIISGSDDQTINVYDTKTGQLLKKLEGHNGGVWALQYWKNTLVSGSTDRTVRVWDIEEGCCTHKFHGHTSTVRCLIIVTPTENPITHKIEPKIPVIITGSRDSNLRIWKLPDIKKDPPYNSSDYGSGSNSNNPYFLKLLNGHTESVRAIAGSGNVLVSGSYDHTVRIWNISTGESTFVLRGHREKVYSIGYSPELQKAASGSMDFNVRVWSTTTGECLFNLDGHSSLVGLLEISPNYIISGAADSTLRIWSAETGQCMSVLNGHQAAISCFHHDPKLNRIVSGSDGGVKLWELYTRSGISKNVTYGKYVRELIRGVQGVWRVRMDERRLVCAVQREGNRTWFEVLDFGSGLDILNDEDFENLDEDPEDILNKAKELNESLQKNNTKEKGNITIDRMNTDDDICSCSNASTIEHQSSFNGIPNNSGTEDEMNVVKDQNQRQSNTSFDSLMVVDTNDTIPTSNFSN
ncbi:WD40 repeat-like protein [Anaeromyces robustus]|uniref:WD40 repeat-like protein n=1 Tax=Anaeromyces robustus TaxID=1754192 RepID=A0A1Y1WXW0_9FUNG|nr:WD40 repeat-like protein [Anaeromyces robustus]|eukprot:ORX78397.1 WD40 repeat-like protein [Anaeromyces robustus]